MFSLFKSNPIKRLEKEIRRNLELARDIQRSGDIKAYSAMMGKIEELQIKLEKLRSKEV